MLIVLRVLEEPVQLAGINVERQQRITIEIIPPTLRRSVRRRGIPRGPEQLIRRRIKHSCDPGRRSADFPGIAFPRLVTRFAWCGRGIESPLALATSRVVCLHESARAVFSPDTPTIIMFFTASGA